MLLRFVPPYKRNLFLNIFFNIVSTILSLFSFAVIIPILEILFQTKEAHYDFIEWGTVSLKDALVNNFYYAVTYLIDTYGQAVALMCLGVALVVMTFFKVGTSYLSSYYIIPIRTGVVRDVRNALYEKIVSLPIGFFTNERKGDVMARMTGDVSEVQNSIMSSLDMLFKNPVMIIVYFATMMSISWQLTVFVLILLPISGYVMGTVGKKLKRQSSTAQSIWGELMSEIEETLGGLRVIKAFNAEGKIIDRFHRTNTDWRSSVNQVNRRQALAHPMSEFLGTATIAVVLWYGGSLILNGESSITAASFIYYLIIFYSIINPAKEFSKASYAVQRGMASIERIDKILGVDNPIKDPVSPKQLGEMETAIEFRDVSFKYSKDWVLRNISFTLEKGKTIALVGQSGSGKSTLVDLLPRFYDVNEGEILVDGIDVRDMKVADLRGIMGNVNQEAILFNDTFYNNITFGVKDATREEVEAAAKIANAHDFIMATEDGYETNVGDRGSRLSGGQRQRISIARAILRNPSILILDEATSALDTESEKLVQEAIENLMKNRTSLVIAHRLSTIKNADQIFVMHEGHIVERGTHDELLKLDRYYKRLVDMQKF